MSDLAPFDRRRRQGSATTLMGSFAVTPPLSPSPRVAVPLTVFVRDERCDACLWPATCESDQTCWKEERAERRRPRGPRAVAGVRETMGQAILRVVAHNGSSTAELAALIGKTERNVYQAARHLTTQGFLVVVRRGPRAGGNLWKKAP